MKLIITNLPSFYKIKLYNRVHAIEPVYVIFTGRNTEGRNANFYSGEMVFPHTFLSGSIIFRCVRLFKILKSQKYDELIAVGWDSAETWFTAFISPIRKNAVGVESSDYESKISGYKLFLKRVFLSRINKCYASGISQKRLMNKLSFKRQIVITGGVGLINYVNQPPFEERKKVEKFLFVGRLSPEKNLRFLIERFNNHPDLSLTIVGFGPLEHELKQIANNNISFIGAVDNEKLSTYYQNADVFVLPSTSEVWGLVVEEALNNGTPVLVSDKVGCRDDLVNEESGVVFSLGIDSFEQALCEIREINRYNRMRKSISRFDFQKRAERQVQAYL